MNQTYSEPDNQGKNAPSTNIPLWKKFFIQLDKQTKWVTRLQWLGLILVFACIPFIFLPHYINSLIYLGYLIGLSFSVSSLIFFWPNLQSFWSSKNKVIKGVRALFHLLSLLLAVIFSRNVVAAATGMPPQDLDLTVYTLSAVFYLPAWLLVVSAISGLIGLLIQALSMIMSFLLINRQRAWRLASHSLGALSLCLLSAAAFAIIFKNQYITYPFAKWAAYIADYQEAKSYPGIALGERVRLHENGVISYANIEDGEIVIRVRKLGDGQ